MSLRGRMLIYLLCLKKFAKLMANFLPAKRPLRLWLHCLLCPCRSGLPFWTLVQVLVFCQYLRAFGFQFQDFLCTGDDGWTGNDGWRVKKDSAWLSSNGVWRKRWDSNPRALSDNCISSAARYDRFDTLPRHILHYNLFFSSETPSEKEENCRRELRYEVLSEDA